MGKTIALITVIAILGTMLVGASVFFHGTEASKKGSKTTQIKVYVKNLEKIDQRVGLWICMKDDDNKCHGEKTINLQNNGKKSKILAATFKIKFSSNPSDEFGPGDVSACDRLKGFGFDTANECVYANNVKVGKNKYKATLDYQDLLDELFASRGDIRLD